MTSPSIAIFNKQNDEALTLCTCYESWSAKIIAETPIDAVLVGDSVAMLNHGYKDTVNADTNLMALHTSAVARTIGDKKFIIGDMPFLSYRKSISDTMTNVEKLMKAGAHSIKLEGVWGLEKTIKHIVDSGIPIMGHIGLTPQSVHAMGGFKVQGKSTEQAEDLIAQAKKLQELGCFSIVLECVPSSLSKEITNNIKIPTIGIGAGPDCDGQILVLHDLLGLNDPTFSPRFVKKFFNGYEEFKDAITQYTQEVKHSDFPTQKESYK